MDEKQIKYFVESALLAAGRPLSADQLQKLFDGRSAPDKPTIRKAIADLVDEYEERGFTISEVASGFRIQIKAAMAEQLHKLWEERPPRYSRALFETLALVAYRQPITRGEIEEIRGVAVSSNIIRTLMERDWVRAVGHRDVPGRPAMFGTTKAFLDYFGLKKLDDLPPLADLSDWESLRFQLDLPDVEEDAKQGEEASGPESDAPSDVPKVHVEGAPEHSHDADDSDNDDDAEDVKSDDEDTDINEALVVEDAEEHTDELVVSEWPDPADSVPVATLKTHNGDDDSENDVSASGG